MEAAKTIARALLQSDHDHDHDHDHDAHAGHDHHIAVGEYTMPVIAIFVILLIGLGGSLIPPLLGLYMPKLDINNRWIFRFFNGVAAGVVLGVAFIHGIPHGFSALQAGLAGKEGKLYTFPWGGLITMVGVLLTFIIEEFVHRNIGRFSALHGHTHDHDHGHSHGEKLDDEKTPDEKLEEGDKPKEMKVDTIEDEAKYFTELYVLLFGLSFHSLFVGITLGVSGDDWGLFAAILFHQFFEGLALGARVARAGFKKKLHIWILDLVYALAIPVGIAIGIGIQSALVEEPVSYEIVNGVFQTLAAGMLIYVALVHMMKDEMARPEFKNGGALMYAMYFGFFVGAGAMAVIGNWA